MKGGILFEHSHRLIATSVGLLTIALAVSVHRSRRDEPALVRMAWGALVLVVFQGLLGGLTVIFRLPTAVSTLHLATSMIFFIVVITLAYRLRPRRNALGTAGEARRWVTLSAIAIYLQVVLGALVRHTDSGLACTDIPLCKGSLWILDADALVQLHMAHRIGAIVIAALVVTTSVHVLRLGQGDFVRILAVVAPALVTLQIGLGLLSVYTALDVVPVTAHLGVGALLLGSTVAMGLPGSRWSGEAPA